MSDPGRSGAGAGDHTLRHRATVARRGLRAGLAVRGGLSLAAALVLLAAGIALARHGMVGHVFPPFVDGGDPVTVTGYSGPWIASAIAVGAIAGLLLVSSVTDLWRRRLIGADADAAGVPPGRGALSGSHTGLGQ